MISLILRINRQNHSNYKFKEIINKNKENNEQTEDANLKKNINTELSLNKIIGLESVKEELRYYLDFIKYREKYKKWNVKLPKGILLIGPPGTGKTLLVKTLAKEIQIPVIHASGSEFVEMYVGVGAARVRKLFTRARSHKNGCLIFIDEIDAIGKKRSTDNSSSSERDNTLNQLLVEIDGFGDDDNILVFGATNLVKNLDFALTRSGRFDKKVYFDPPNKEERQKLFNLYLNEISLSHEICLEKLAELTSGLNGADIANICNQSKINAIQKYIKLKGKDSENEGKDSENEHSDSNSEENQEITMENIQKAIDEIMIGREKPERKMDKEERERVAHHEAGHAFLSFILKHGSSPIKVSILPRGENALGFSQPKPQDKKLYTEDYLLAQISILLGGRISEKIIYGNYSTGAYDDIERATNLIKQWFLVWGMDTSSGPLNYNVLYNRKVSEEMTNKIRFFVKNIERLTYNILMKNKEYIILLAELLLKKETIIYSDIIELLPKELENRIDTMELIY